MNKPLEFWIKPTADYRTDHILTKKEYEEKLENRFCVEGWILVQEITHQDKIWDEERPSGAV